MPTNADALFGSVNRVSSFIPTSTIEMVLQAVEQRLSVHRCRFLTYTPSTITALAFSPDESRLAVGRESGDIEVWHKASSWTCEVVFPSPSSSSGGVRGLAWLSSEFGNGTRLLSASACGRLHEWNFASLRPKLSLDSCGGGVVHCLAVSADRTRVALGCEDGSVRIFDISADSMLYMRSLACRGSSVLSVAWAPDGSMLVSGDAAGIIRVFSCDAFHNEHRITLDDSNAVQVNALVVLPDNTIVSGSSDGKVQFWDGAFGTLLQNVRQHTAAVLTLTASASGDAVFASGVDYKLVKFVRVSAASGFIVGAHVRRHTHEVRALAVSHAASVVVSGGVDTQLCVFNVEKLNDSVEKVAPFLHRDCISLARQRRVFLQRCVSSVQLWRVSDLTSGVTPSDAAYRRLLDLNMPDDATLLSSAISACGEFVACSDATRARLYRLSYATEGAVAVASVERLSISQTVPASSFVCFSDNSKWLLAGGIDGVVRILCTDTLELLGELHEHLDPNAIDAAIRIERIVCGGSGKSRRIVSVDSRNVVHTFRSRSSSKGKGFVHCGELCKLQSRVLCAAFQPDSDVLVLGCASNRFFLYNVVERKLCDWSRRNLDLLPESLLSQSQAIVHASFDPALPSVLLLHSHSFLCKVDLSKVGSTFPSFLRPLIALVLQDLDATAADGDIGVGEGKAPPTKRRRRFCRSLTEHRGGFGCNTDMMVPFSVNDAAGSALGASPKQQGGALQLIHKFRPMLFADFLAEHELLVVETPWRLVMQQFAKPLDRAQYGL